MVLSFLEKNLQKGLTVDHLGRRKNNNGLTNLRKATRRQQWHTRKRCSRARVTPFQQRRQPLCLVSVQTGAIKRRFDRLEQVWKVLNCTRSSISRYIRNGTLIHGMKLVWTSSICFHGEEWRACVVARNYEVSNVGRIRNVSTQRGL